MARDSSPFSHRLKALAQRAGLPVEADKPAPAPEQPTDDSPAVVPGQHAPPASLLTDQAAHEDATWGSVEEPGYTGEFNAAAGAQATDQNESAFDEPAPAAAPQQYTGETEVIPAVGPRGADQPALDDLFPAPTPQPDFPSTELQPALGAEDASSGDDLAVGSSDEAPTPKRSFGSRMAALRNLGPKPAAPESPEAPAANATTPAQGTAEVGMTTGAQAAVAPAPDEPFAAQEPDLPAKPTFAERASLRRRARALRARRDAGLVELGAIVLDQRRFGDASGGSLVRRRTDELCDLEAELSSLEVALDEERSTEAVAALGILRCTSCSTLLGPADAFCAACGTARAAAEPAPASDAS